jgi:hypothetical protein
VSYGTETLRRPSTPSPETPLSERTLLGLGTLLYDLEHAGLLLEAEAVLVG